MPGCGALGEYRAPKSRDELASYWWLCLEHVRAYNASWDFYKGMTPVQIEAQVRADTSWQRPTWPLGRLGAAIDEAVLRDPLHVLNAGFRRDGARAGRAAGTSNGASGGDSPHAPPELREPLAALGLDWPITMSVLKARYKDLAKKHHPDANGGDRAAEERLKTINLAYAAVRGRLAAAPRMAATG